MNWEDRHNTSGIKESILALADGIKKGIDPQELSMYAMAQGIPLIVPQDAPKVEEPDVYADSYAPFQEDFIESQPTPQPQQEPEPEPEDYYEESYEYYESSWCG
jgi:hypothetical protein